MKRCGFTLVELLVVIAIIGILVGLLLPAVQLVRESARRAACQNQIRQIALALEHYHSQHNRFPYGWNDEQGDNSSGWGWMAYSLPFIEQVSLADRIEYQVDIRDQQFAELIQTHLPLMHCPSSPDRNVATFQLQRRGGTRADDAEFPISIARSQYVGCIGTLTTQENVMRGL